MLLLVLPAFAVVVHPPVVHVYNAPSLVTSTSLVSTRALVAPEQTAWFFPGASSRAGPALVENLEALDAYMHASVLPTVERTIKRDIVPAMTRAGSELGPVVTKATADLAPVAQQASTIVWCDCQCAMCSRA